MKRAAGALVISILLIMNSLVPAAATRYTSPNYTIDASVGNSFGGNVSSTNYRLTGSGGESIIGNGAGGSYLLGQGYASQLSNQRLTMTAQARGLVSYYSMQEAVPDGGIMPDDSALNLTGMRSVNSPGVAPGIYQNANTFDGSTQHYESTSGVQLQSVGVGEQRSFEAWFKTSVTDAAHTGMIMYKEGDCNGWGIRYLGNQRIRASFSAPSGGCSDPNFSYAILTSPTGTYGNGEWHHVIFVVDRSTGAAELYLDGQSVQTNNTVDTSGTAFWTGHMFIGTDYRGASSPVKFNGAIDEVRIYDRALSAYQVKALYDAGQQGRASGIAFNDQLTAGTSRQAEAEVIVDSTSSYHIAIQGTPMQNGPATIAPIAAPTSSPANWSEGTTHGLGFSIASSSTVAPDGKWNNGNSYAGVPSSAEAVYVRPGGTAGKDRVVFRYRAGVASDQPAGKYSGTVVYTGTTIP